jgi:enoyl-CoA hydratase/carnithine racemase
MSDEVLSVEIEDGVGWMRLDRPKVRNAINEDVLRALKEAVERLEQDDAVNVLMLKGEGPCFSAGVDLRWLAGGIAGRLDVNSDDGVRLRRFIRWIQQAIASLEACEKPTIAMIHGFCGGLGLEIALGCDLRIAGRSAQVGLPEVLLGIIPDCGGTTRLTRIAGPTRAKQLIMTGEMIPAEQAERYDILNEVCDDDALEARCRELAAKLCTRPSAAVGLAKRLIDIGAGLDSQRFMQLEGLAQSILMGSPNLGKRVAQGMALLKERK